MTLSANEISITFLPLHSDLSLLAQWELCFLVNSKRKQFLVWELL